MTDLERLREAFTAIGVKVVERVVPPGEEVYVGTGPLVNGGTEIVTDAREGQGYYGFFHTFTFDHEGKFVGHGGWE